MDRKNRLNTENKSDCLAVHLPLIIGTFFRPHKETGTGTGIAGFCLQKTGNRNRQKKSLPADPYFKADLKLLKLSAERTTGGRLFHNLGALTEKR